MNHSSAAMPDLLNLLWRRKSVLVASGLGTGVAALCIAAALPSTFVSEGLLLVAEHEAQLPELVVVSSAQPSSSARNRTEADLLRSHAMIEAVVQHLDLANDPAFTATTKPSPLKDALVSVMREAADGIGGSVGESIKSALPAPPAKPGSPERIEATVEAVKKNLQVLPNDNSRVLTVRFTAKSPVVAAAVVNALFDRYITNEVTASREQMLQTNCWLSDRAAALRPEVEEADRAVQRFRDANPSFEVAQGSLTQVQLSNEQTELSAAREDLARRQSAIRAAVGSDFPEALASPVIQQLRTREADASQRMAIIGRRLGVLHPDYLAAANSLQEVRLQIEAATTKVVGSMQKDVTRAANRVADLQASIAASQAVAKRSIAISNDLSQLQREKEAKWRVYEAFMTRAAETQPSSAQFASARIISPATLPFRPDNLPLPVVGGFGILAGCFAAAASIILRHVQRGGVGSARELALLMDVPCLGALPALRRRRLRRGPAPLLDDHRDGAVETLRAMRFSIQAMATAKAGSAVSVLVTSSGIGEGKTTVAASFARLCAADGQRVLLVEADLRRPRLACTLGLQPNPEFTAVLSDMDSLANAVHVDPGSGLHYLIAERGVSNPQELLRSNGFASLLLQARRSYDLVVLDSPPVLHVADPLLIAGLTDVILFAVRWERTPRTLVAEGLRRIPETSHGRVATVLTQVPADRLGREDHYAGYSMRLQENTDAVLRLRWRRG